MQYEIRFTDYFLCKMQSNGKNRVDLRPCGVAMETVCLLGMQEFDSKNWH